MDVHTYGLFIGEMNLEERLEELEERIAQMRKAFAPTLLFPPEWRLTPLQRDIVQVLIAQPILTPSSFGQYSIGNDVLRDDVRNLSVQIFHIRRKLKSTGAKITAIHGIGYRLEDRKALADACNRELEKFQANRSVVQMPPNDIEAVRRDENGWRVPTAPLSFEIYRLLRRGYKCNQIAKELNKPNRMVYSLAWSIKNPERRSANQKSWIRRNANKQNRSANRQSI